jgi:opacity protein-like surface antigen
LAYQRHCERSEAIHFTAAPRRKMDCFVASAFARRRASADKSAPRNDVVTFRFKFQTADVRSHSRGTTCPSHTVTLSLKHPRSRVQRAERKSHTSTVTNSVKSSWLATIRPRFGYAWNRTLVYVTGGAAFSDLRYTQSIVTTLAAATGALAVSSTRVGWTVGAGFEYAVTNNWSIKAEYLYTQFGALSGTSALVANDGSGFSNIYNASSGEQRDHVVRAGLNYHFNGPVVARY